MDKKIDLHKWKRKEHFEFFNQFEEPFYGVTVQMDMTTCVASTSKHGYSLTRYYMFQFIKTIQQSEAFRLRIRNGEVFLLDPVHLGTTVLKADETFNYILIPYAHDFLNFDQNYIRALQEGKLREGLFPNGEDTDRQIHTSVLPWTKFSSLSHARQLKGQDSVPKVSFGKITRSSDSISMPISIHVHHALVDGLHVGLFIKKFQENLDS